MIPGDVDYVFKDSRTAEVCLLSFVLYSGSEGGKGLRVYLC